MATMPSTILMLPSEIMIMITDHYLWAVADTTIKLWADRKPHFGWRMFVRKSLEDYLTVFPGMSARLYKLADVAEEAGYQAYEEAWLVFRNNHMSPDWERLRREYNAASQQNALFAIIKQDVMDWSI